MFTPWDCNSHRAGVLFHYQALLQIPSTAQYSRSTLEQNPLGLQTVLFCSTTMPYDMHSWKTDIKSVLVVASTNIVVWYLEGRRRFTPNWIILINTQWQLAVQQTQHLIEHLRQTTLIHKDPVTQTPSQPYWLREMRHGAEKKRGHVLPSGGEDGGRLALREADPLSKYLMSFRTVGLFQPLHLQNNSHYIPSLLIIYAFRAPKSTKT